MRPLLPVLSLLFALAAVPAAAVSKVDNFRLLDQDLRAHELYYHKDATAIVLLVQSNGCPIARNLVPDLRAIRDAYAERGVEFMLINSSIQDTRKAIAEEAESFGIDFPILIVGTSDKAEAARRFPVLSRVKSYPACSPVSRSPSRAATPSAASSISRNASGWRRTRRSATPTPSRRCSKSAAWPVTGPAASVHGR